MNITIEQTLALIHLGEPQIYRNIVLLPIIGPWLGGARWLTLGEALEQQLLKDQIVHAAFFHLPNDTKPAADTINSIRARRRPFTE